MTPYATEAQLETWLQDGVDTPVAAEALRLLARASSLLDDVVRRPFTLDEDDLPADPDVAQALADACCAQVEYWLVGPGEEHDIEGMAGRQVSVGHLSVDALPPRLAPRAYDALHTAGLLSTSDVGTSTAWRFFATQQGI